MAQMTPTCLICGKGLSKPATGRPPTFCGSECKRLAEYRSRRIQRQLEKLDKAQSDARIYAATYGGGELSARQLEALAGEVALLEDQLRVLVTGTVLAEPVLVS
jgi:hypothetical protein